MFVAHSKAISEDQDVTPEEAFVMYAQTLVAAGYAKLVGDDVLLCEITDEQVDDALKRLAAQRGN